MNRHSRHDDESPATPARDDQGGAEERPLQDRDLPTARVAAHARPRCPRPVGVARR